LRVVEVFNDLEGARFGGSSHIWRPGAEAPGPGDYCRTLWMSIHSNSRLRAIELLIGPPFLFGDKPLEGLPRESEARANATPIAMTAAY
jgi:hypothetical protein